MDTENANWEYFLVQEKCTSSLPPFMRPVTASDLVEERLLAGLGRAFRGTGASLLCRNAVSGRCSLRDVSGGTAYREGGLVTVAGDSGLLSTAVAVVLVAHSGMQFRSYGIGGTLGGVFGGWCVFKCYLRFVSSLPCYPKCHIVNIRRRFWLRNASTCFEFCSIEIVKAAFKR